MIEDWGCHDWLVYGSSFTSPSSVVVAAGGHPSLPPLAAAVEGHPLDGSSSPLLQAVVVALMQNILLE